MEIVRMDTKALKHVSKYQEYIDAMEGLGSLEAIKVTQSEASAAYGVLYKYFERRGRKTGRRTMSGYVWIYFVNENGEPV